tara:strand:+ start:2483 stop:3817 length:1335 start_codon:yes stop_codon:yes gene_type:complete
MAQVQDLSGLLTGISSQAPIDPRVGLTPMQQLQASGMASSEATRKAAGGLMSSITGKEVNVQTSRERAQSELAGLDVNDPKDQPRILEIYTRLDPNKAAQLKAAFAQQGRNRLAEGAVTAKTAARQGSIVNAIKTKYPNRPDLQEMAKQGVSFKEINDFAETDVDGRYKVAGNNVLDTKTGKYLPPPPSVGKGGYTVSKVYDPVRGVNVIKYLDKDDPTIVLDERLDAVDVGRQSASLLRLQSQNLTAANEAGTEYKEAVSVANRLEKAAAGGMTGGVLATGEEFIKKVLGTEDEVTLLRKAADRLRVSRGVANLPVGPASDKDVALVMGGELSATANPATVASYVKGIAKLAKAEKEFFTDQNGWLDRYKDIGGFSSYLVKEQLEEQLGHSDIIAAVEKLAAVNYDPTALAIFEEKFGFNYADAKEELGRANATLSQLKREDF